MRIIFFGEDSFSLLALKSLYESEHTILQVLCPLYRNSIHRRLEIYCLKNSIDFSLRKDFSSEEFIRKIKNQNPDLFVVCHFQRLLKKELIEIPRFGAINLHPSMLPKYRGMSPQHWPIINGEKYTGITVHFIDEGVDTGDIIIQKKILIKKDYYVSDLQNQFKPIYKIIFNQAIELIESKNVNFFKQSHLKGSYYGKLKIDNCIINTNFSIVNAYNLIRAVSFPYFGARYNNLIIWNAEIMENVFFKKHKQLPLGYFEINSSKKGKYIKFVDGILKLLKYEREDN
jgi:methionyl-tRNA formyltransferase